MTRRRLTLGAVVSGACSAALLAVAAAPLAAQTDARGTASVLARPLPPAALPPSGAPAMVQPAPRGRTPVVPALPPSSSAPAIRTARAPGFAYPSGPPSVLRSGTAMGRPGVVVRPGYAPRHAQGPLDFTPELGPGEQLVGEPVIYQDGQVVPGGVIPGGAAVEALPPGVPAPPSRSFASMAGDGAPVGMPGLGPMFDEDCASCGHGHAAGAPCGGDFCGPGDCGGRCGGVCDDCCLIPCPSLNLRDMTIFGGAHGFMGPLNRGGTGSFGFHEGMTLSGPVRCFNWLGLSRQFGFTATHSNFNGFSIANTSRHQYFAQAGLFRRVDWGLQGGAVFEYLNEDWYLQLDLMQVRAELSWVYPGGFEFGAWTAISLRNSTSPVTVPVFGPTPPETYQSEDLYAAFVRTRFDECYGGGEGRIFAGFTGSGDALLGGDALKPLTRHLALQTEFAYRTGPQLQSAQVVPGPPIPPATVARESWNVGFSIVLFPGGVDRSLSSYDRPLFSAPSNSTFMHTRIQ